MITRRLALLGLAAIGLGGARLALTAGPAGEARLVVVLLRGALDGLAAVPPYGEAALAALRPAPAPGEPGRENGVLDLGGHFGLHPALAALHGCFTAGEAIVFHAAAGPWRSRSHFDAQDFLESGAERRLSSGWLNRALRFLPPEPPGAARRGLAVGPFVPLLLRGEREVGAFSTPDLPRAAAETLELLTAWHGADPVLGAPFAEGLRGRGFAHSALGGDPGGVGDPFRRLALSAGRLLARADGPRVAALETGGWDTHAAQGPRLRAALLSLDAGLAALREGLDAAWHRTAVLVVTEFGRTVRFNGTGGTDHGTGGVAFLLGGAVRGGRVVADWPGLLPAQLLEGRDLQPTLDIRRLAKAALRDHLRLPPAAMAAAFPDSGEASPLDGLFRASAG